MATSSEVRSERVTPRGFTARPPAWCRWRATHGGLPSGPAIQYQRGEDWCAYDETATQAQVSIRTSAVLSGEPAACGGLSAIHAAAGRRRPSGQDDGGDRRGRDARTAAVRDGRSLA